MLLLIDLPNDLLVGLPEYLESIHDFFSLVTSCRRFYDLFDHSKTALPPILRRRDGQYILQPQTHLLVAGVARRVGDWAAQSAENRSQFHNAVKIGVEGLARLCEQVSRVTLADLRELHRIKYDILNPLSKLIDWEDGPGSRKYGDYETVIEHAELVVLNHWIYCDLFHATITGAYKPVHVVAPLTNEIRLDYVRYCIPDINSSTQEFVVPFHDRPASEDHGLNFQQLDMKHLLCDTSYWLKYLKGSLGYNPNIEAGDDAVRILQHSGLKTMQFVLAYNSDYGNKYPAAMGELEALRDEVDRHLGEKESLYVDENSDPFWVGLIEDINELW